MKNYPKITVITVSYNTISSIEQTILSVVNQIYPNIEYIILDGGSHDGTVDIIKKYQDKISYWISEPDKGIYDAMNKGIKIASGVWVNFMNAGDIFCDNSVISALFCPEQKSESDIIYGDTEFIYAFGKYVKKPLPLESLQYSMTFCHQSTFVKTKLLKEMPFNTQYQICADYDFFYSCMKQGRIFKYVPQVVSVFDGREGLSSSNKIKRMLEFGKISGCSKTAKWKLEYLSFVVDFKIKQLIKQFIPDKLSYKIRKWNYERLSESVN